MNAPESIIEKIRALLRLAKSDNPHEASLALQRAAEIATKHALDLSDISPDDDLAKLLGELLPCPARLAREWVEAYNIVHGFFNVDVTVLKGTSRVLFVGTKLDIEIAEYICTFLVRSCRDCLSVWKKSERSRRRKTSGSKVANFVDGFFYAIRVDLRKKRDSQTSENEGLAIVLSNGREARTAEANKILGTPGTAITLAPARKDRSALISGMIAGSKTQINPGLRGSNSTLALH